MPADGPSPPRRRPRLRLLTLAELVGIAALVIAGLGWWDGHHEHQQQDADRAAARSAQATEAKRANLRDTFLLTGSVDSDRIRLASARSDQVIQTQTVIFPTAVRSGVIETTGNPRIDRGWFEDGVKKAGRTPKGDAEARLPVGIVTTYVEAGETRTDRSIYQIGYTAHRRLLLGRKLELDGLSLARRGVAGDLQAAVDAAWDRAS
ncbi:MAG: hypothetical protein E7812_18925 [Phenylobacterium sp.]|nr:MAG: hypothetical protein E7812_18925 [Phenylobacterium sp.]